MSKKTCTVTIECSHLTPTLFKNEQVLSLAPPPEWGCLSQPTVLPPSPSLLLGHYSVKGKLIAPWQLDEEEGAGGEASGCSPNHARCPWLGGEHGVHAAGTALVGTKQWRESLGCQLARYRP